MVHYYGTELFSIIVPNLVKAQKKKRQNKEEENFFVKGHFRLFTNLRGCGRVVGECGIRMGLSINDPVWAFH